MFINTPEISRRIYCFYDNTKPSEKQALPCAGRLLGLRGWDVFTPEKGAPPAEAGGAARLLPETHRFVGLLFERLKEGEVFLAGGEGGIGEGAGSAELAVFAEPEPVIGEQLDPRDGERGEERRQLRGKRLGEIHARDQRDADDDFRQLGRLPEICKDQLVALSGITDMLRFVEELYVKVDALRPLREPEKGGGLRKAAGLERYADPLRPEPVGQREGEVRLRRDLPAGEGDAAAGVGKVVPVAQDDLRYLVDGIGFARRPDPVESAEGLAPPAEGAAGEVRPHASLPEGEGALPAGGEADPAGGARRRRLDQQLGGGRLRLGVAAPRAAQGTALEEDGRPDPLSVEEAEPLNVEDQSSLVYHFIPPDSWQVRRMMSSCSARSIVVKRTEKPATHTIRVGYFSGWSCASRRTASSNTLNWMCCPPCRK